MELQSKDECVIHLVLLAVITLAVAVTVLVYSDGFNYPLLDINIIS